MKRYLVITKYYKRNLVSKRLDYKTIKIKWKFIVAISNLFRLD